MRQEGREVRIYGEEVRQGVQEVTKLRMYILLVICFSLSLCDRKASSMDGLLSRFKVCVCCVCRCLSRTTKEGESVQCWSTSDCITVWLSLRGVV